jgi:hypothetical protein
MKFLHSDRGIHLVLGGAFFCLIYLLPFVSSVQAQPRNCDPTTMTREECLAELDKVCTFTPGPIDGGLIEGCGTNRNGKWYQELEAAFAANLTSGSAEASDQVDLTKLGINPGLDISIANPFKVNGLEVKTIEGLILAILNLLVVIMTPLLALTIIFAGFKYVTAQGNPGKVSEAHQALTYAIIGAVLVLGAITLSEVLRATLSAFRS